MRGGPGGAGVTDQAIAKLRDGRTGVNIAMCCDGPTSLKAAVRQKMGVGIVLADSIRSELASGEFKIVKVLGPGAGRAELRRLAKHNSPIICVVSSLSSTGSACQEANLDRPMRAFVCSPGVLTVRR